MYTNEELAAMTDEERKKVAVKMIKTIAIRRIVIPMAVTVAALTVAYFVEKKLDSKYPYAD